MATIATPAVQSAVKTALATPVVQSAAAVQSAVKTAKVAKLYPVGQTKIYLPRHVVTFIRPKLNQPANHATFIVPLSFNKLDLRDYLFHGYNVRVKGVRSFINHKPVKATAGSAWNRGKAQKLMIADLVQPFYWPKPPGVEDREAFDYEQFATMHKWMGEQKAKQEDRAAGKPRLISREPLTEARKKMQQQMKQFMMEPELWKEGGRPLEKIKQDQVEIPEGSQVGIPGWEEVEEDLDISFDEADAEAAERKAEDLDLSFTEADAEASEMKSEGEMKAEGGKKAKEMKAKRHSKAKGGVKP